MGASFIGDLVVALRLARPDAWTVAAKSDRGGSKMSPASRMSPQYDEAAAIVRETKDVQDVVVSALIQYLELANKMREFEDAFTMHILGSAGELFVTRMRRQQLEVAYRRIQEKLDNGEYGSNEELREEVDAALEFPEVAEPGIDEGRLQSDDELDTVTKERIYRAFRRIVLPRVHSDTSDADVSEFEIAYAAYKSRDYVLMEAFIIRYQENLGLEEDGRFLTLAQLTTRLQEYQAAQKRLENRLTVLQREVLSAEIKTPERARELMEEQGEKFRQAIIEEAEKLRRLQDDLEGLVGAERGREGARNG